MSMIIDGHKWHHATTKYYPDHVIGYVIVDEKPGYTGIYLRGDDGSLFPARTVYRRSKKHHDSVVHAWLQRPGAEDLRRRRSKVHTKTRR